MLLQFLEDELARPVIGMRMCEGRRARSMGQDVRAAGDWIRTEGGINAGAADVIHVRWRISRVYLDIDADRTSRSRRPTTTVTMTLLINWSTVGSINTLAVFIYRKKSIRFKSSSRDDDLNQLVVFLSIYV